MRSRRAWWLIFGGCVLGMVAALLWVSLMVLRLEAQAQHQAAVRMALWRMDSWLGPRLAREAARPYFEYLPFYAQQRAYTKILNPIEPNEVYTPSPLLNFELEYFPLHFQVSAAGELTSPQTPLGNWRDLAESAYLQPGAIDRKQPLLERVRRIFNLQHEIAGCVEQAETLLAQLAGEGALEPAPPPQQQQQVQQWASGAQQDLPVQNALSKADVQRRASVNDQQIEWRQSIDVEPAAVEVGSLVPLWLPCGQNEIERPGDDVPKELIFIRRVHIGGQKLYQGMLANWPALRTALADQIADLFPGAGLVPLTQPSVAQAQIETGRLLASIPVLLDAPCPSMAAGPMITPARTTLALTWLAVGLAVFAAAVTLRASIAYANKRSRFASAVTHELRTPLTTFRMYSEMLAEGMVRDEAQRRTYLQTLKSESGRLATLVENVLSYARLEDGRIATHPAETTIAGLLHRLTPALSRRADEAGMTLKVQNAAPSDASITIDSDAVDQILFNLVDNACKYAGNGSANDRTIELEASLRHRQLALVVRDHGPGIAPEHARTIFKPFDRGAHQPGDTIPGVGLGLALSREWARELGGELTLESPCSDGGSSHARGACFRLSLPV